MTIGINVEGSDPTTGITHMANVQRRNGHKGLVVFTDVLITGDILFQPALNDELGNEMNIDGTFGGVPDKVHDGIDSTLWTGTSIVGTKFTFNATPPVASPISGGNAIRVNKAITNDTLQLDNGSDVGLSSFVGITFYVYVTSGWTAGDSVSFYGYDTGGSVQVGTKILIEDFINEFEFGTWQKVSLPLANLNLVAQTIDSFRIEIETKSGSGPDFYIDDVQIEQTSGSKSFSILAPKGTKYFISEFRFSFVDALASTLLNNSMPFISYDKILGVSKLTTGISFSRVRQGNVLFSASIRCIGDSIKGGGDLINQISDGVNTCVTLRTRFRTPVLLDSRDEDAVVITINDDLTGLISFTALAMGRTEDIS